MTLTWVYSGHTTLFLDEAFDFCFDMFDSDTDTACHHWQILYQHRTNFHKQTCGKGNNNHWQYTEYCPTWETKPHTLLFLSIHLFDSKLTTVTTSFATQRNFKHCQFYCDHKCRLLGQLVGCKYACVMRSFSHAMCNKQWPGNQHLYLRCLKLGCVDYSVSKPLKNISFTS